MRVEQTRKMNFTVGIWFTYGSACRIMSVVKVVMELNDTYNHRTHRLFHTPFLKFKVAMLIPDSLKIKKWPSEVFLEEHQ